MLYLENTLFYTTPSKQMVSYHVTDVKMFRFFRFILDFDYPTFQEFYLKTLKVEMLAGSQSVQK